MDKEYRFATVKLNGGRGALLCSDCRVVIREGLEHEDREHFCGQCRLRRGQATWDAGKATVPAS